MDNSCKHHSTKLTPIQFVNSTEPVAGKRTCASCGKKIRVSPPFILLHCAASVLWGLAVFYAVPRIVYFHFSAAGGLLAFFAFAASTALWMLAGTLTVNYARYVACKKK